MAEIKRPVCSNTKCPMVLHGTCTIGKNEAGCNYEIFANTPAAKNAANVFMDNSVALQFKKPMPKILAVVTDKVDEKQVFLGSTLRVDTIFSHEIEYKRGTFTIEVSPKENVVIENQNVLVDRHTLRNIFKVVKTGEVTFTVKYTDENGTESTANVAVTVIEAKDYVAPPAEVIRLVSDKEEVISGEAVTIQVRTDVAIENATDVTIITVGSGLTKKGEPVLLSDKKTVKQVYTAATPGNVEVSAKTAKGSVTKKISVTVKAKDPTPGPDEEPKITAISAAPTAIDIGEDTLVTIQFDKAPKLSDVTITPDNNKLTQKIAPALVGTNVTVTYTGKAAGEAKIVVAYKGASKETKVTVNQPVAKAVLQSITAAPTSQAVGKDVVITCTFDKAPVLSEVTITPDSAHFDEKTPKAIEGNNVTVTYTVKGTNGAAKVTAVHNGVTKECTVTVTGAQA